MHSIVKMTHAAITEKRDPRVEINRFLLNYRNTPHATTGKRPTELLMGRKIKTKIPTVITPPTGRSHV